MSRQMQDFFTVEQLAKRWNTDGSYVYQLILSSRLPQAYLVAGPARLVQETGDSSPLPAPLARCERLEVRLLVHTRAGFKDRFCWPLAEVHTVYECIGEDSNQTHCLVQMCEQERACPRGWRLQFDPRTTQIGGQDSFLLVLRSLADTSLISATDMAEFERQGQPPQHASVDVRRPATAKRDSRKQRCRVAAQILWERDPRATIPDLHRSEWIRRIACEGHPPNERTFRDWVKDLNPDRSPGRRAT